MNNFPISIQQKAHQVFHINVFTQHAHSGNSATVIWLSSGLCDSQMQLLAREFNTPESIFLSIVNDELFVLFFTPTQEVSSCGHGTIAAAYVADKKLNSSSTALVLNTTVGRIKVRGVNDHYQEYMFEVPVPTLEACIDVPKSIIASLTNIDANTLDVS